MAHRGKPFFFFAPITALLLPLSFIRREGVHCDVALRVGLIIVLAQ